MSSKTKIIVLKSKELIYTGIFIVLGILLILLLWYMFSPKEDEKDTTDTSISTETFATYQPGVYTSQLNLGGTTLELQTTIDKHAVTHIEVSNTNETVTAMYPLLTPSVDAINEQLQITGDLDSVTYAATTSTPHCSYWKPPARQHNLPGLIQTNHLCVFLYDYATRLIDAFCRYKSTYRGKRIDITV